MITVDQVGWTGYLNFEGPWFRGQQGLEPVWVTNTLDQKILAVITATEGGHYDAINMYDRMICSVGLIQWGDAGQFSVCEMLGEVAGTATEALTYLQSYVSTRGYTFQKTMKGWRFVKGSDIVDTISKQQALYLGGSNGQKGQWNDTQKEWAKGFVKVMQLVWDNPKAREAQLQFTAARLRGFAMPTARSILFNDAGAADADQNIVQAAQAAFLSFAANLPAVASTQLIKLDTQAPKWSLEWLDALLRQLTFGPQIAIYPHRYDAIRPVLERLWGLDLPDTDAELAQWHEAMGLDPAAPAEENLTTPKSIQEALLTLGEDLGPSGADGVFGAMTKAAIMEFQKAHGLSVDGTVGSQTLAALRTALAQKS